MDQTNPMCISQTASTIARLLDESPRQEAAPALRPVLKKVREQFGEARCSRIFMYNPDAVALWIFKKYREQFQPLLEIADVKLRLRSVFPPVTPVCFASMYTGLSPQQHGITKYEKPVLNVPTVFDDVIRAGKKAAIVSTAGDSISEIFLDRPIEYYIYKKPEQCNQKAMELIMEDRHDLIVLYNGNYDYYMHRFGPEGLPSLNALKNNIRVYTQLEKQIRQYWGCHDSVLAFAPDHGCHRKYGLFGDHGIDRPCDMEVPHFYSLIRHRY